MSVFKINLFVTDGCAACQMMSRTLAEILDEVPIIVNVKEYNINKLMKEPTTSDETINLIRDIKDTPTLVFYSEDVIKFKLVGNYSKEYLYKCINSAAMNYFSNK